MNSNETISASSSLANLHDIVVPDAVSWWPLAPGWYALFAVALVCAIALAIRGFLRYRRNAYRREAMVILRQTLALPASLHVEVAALLKRTALSAFPHEKVAALTGAPWLEFLDRTGATDDFSIGGGRVLGAGQYGSDPLNDSERADLIRAAGSWIQNHQAEGDVEAC